MSCSDKPDPHCMENLRSPIQRVFSTYIKPCNVLPYFQKYSPNILVARDIDLVKAVTNSRGDIEGADLLLERLQVYPGWFSCTLKVLADPEVKLPHVASQLQEIKEKLDNNKEQEEKKEKLEIEELKDQLRQKDQQILELQAGREQEADQTRGEQNSKKKLTWKVATELEKVERDVEEERKRHKEELDKKDHVISDLKQEKEIIIKEREKQVAEREAQTLTTTLQLVFSPSRSDGVTVFNYVMTSRMQRDYPDMARKYCIKRCDVPPNFKRAVERMEEMKSRLGNDLLDEIEKDDLPIMKNKMNNILQKVQDEANRRRDDYYTEDNRKFLLLCDIVVFFNYCSVYLSRLEKHGVKEMSEFLLHSRDSIIEIIDPLVDEIGGWIVTTENSRLYVLSKRWTNGDEMD